MAVIEQKIQIECPRMDVFRKLTDFDRFSDWQSSLINISVTEGTPVRIGTMISMTRKFTGRTVFWNLDVVDYQPGKTLEFQGAIMAFPSRRTIEVNSLGRTTEIKDTIDLRTGCLYFWYAPILSNRLKAQTAEEWQTLKQKLESGWR